MGDGLKVLDNDQVDTIIIAGLGGDKIINIFIIVVKIKGHN